jgi:hypothetical protein
VDPISRGYYLVSWSSTWLEGLGEVAEHEADAVVREEQVPCELGVRGPLLLLRLLCQPIPVSLHRRGWDRPGPRIGVGGEAGGAGSRVVVGRGSSTGLWLARRREAIGFSSVTFNTTGSAVVGFPPVSPRGAGAGPWHPRAGGSGRRTTQWWC